MPRRQRDLDPDGGPTTELARRLRELRARAGDPKFDTMARRTGRSKTALAEAAGGRRLPRWETVEDFVRACDADPAPWRERWEAARSGQGTAATTGADGPTVPVADRTDADRTDADTDTDADADPARATAPPTSHTPARYTPARYTPWRGRWWVPAAAAAVLAAGATGFAVGRGTASPDAPVGPLLRAVEVQNKVALGADRLVEDRTPAYLSTLPLAYCAAPSRSCKVPGTEMGSGVGIVANCVTTGQRMWNFDLGEAAAHGNPDRAESERWYRVSFPDGRSGYLSEVYLGASSRGGLGLPGCGPTVGP